MDSVTHKGHTTVETARVRVCVHGFCGTDVVHIRSLWLRFSCFRVILQDTQSGVSHRGKVIICTANEANTAKPPRDMDRSEKQVSCKTAIVGRRRAGGSEDLPRRGHP